MFAAATREVVFSNPEVIRVINKHFIPVALKAGNVNNPPAGLEGQLYAEIKRTRPAPQGICTLNSAGRVLSWALSFDSDAEIPKFFEHVVRRYQRFPGAETLVDAERYQLFPSRKLDDVTGRPNRLPDGLQHEDRDRCPGTPSVPKGTLVGRIVGRPLDPTGKPIQETTRQEQYMEARFEVPTAVQAAIESAAGKSKGERFPLPKEFGRALVGTAYLGQLDVNPISGRRDAETQRSDWSFWAERLPSKEEGVVRLRLGGDSDVEGRQAKTPRTDGRQWEHRIRLHWQGFVDLHDGRILRLKALAEGDERLRWGRARMPVGAKYEARMLMAGHRINFKGRVRYGLTANPASKREVGAETQTTSNSLSTSLRKRMSRVRALIEQRQAAGDSVQPIAKRLSKFQRLMEQQSFNEAYEALGKILEDFDTKN
ncbi:MAG: hypothetical protein AAF517_24780 [Planctomycetota bacterium]